MNAPCVPHYSACARCVHGDGAGTECSAPQLRVMLQPVPTLASVTRARWCGPNAAWHVYRANASAPPLYVAAHG